MAVLDILPTSNLKMVDIRDTLGLSSNSLKDYFNANVINWNSKYKPVVYPANFLDNDYRWKGEDGMCGLSVKSVSSYSQIPGEYDGDMNGWEYNAPYGGENAPYRIGDFRGYCHKAVPMVSGFYVPDRVSKQGDGIFQATVMVSNIGGNSLTLADLALSSYYAGIVVTDSNDVVKGATIGTKLTNGFSVLARLTSFSMASGQTYKCYPMIANASTLADSNKFWTLPNVNPKEIAVTSSYFNVAIMAEKVGNNTVDYTITITNTSTAVTWSNNGFKLRFMENEYADTLESGEKSGQLTSPITIPADGELVLEGSITGISSTLYNEPVMRLWVSFNSGYEVQDFVITENTRE